MAKPWTPRSPGYRPAAPWQMETETLTVRQIKDSFWANVMNPKPGVTRLVARADMKAGGSNGDVEPAELIGVWTPKSVDEDFNLVMSLCTDGKHRLTLDYDQGRFTNSQEDEFVDMIAMLTDGMEHPHMVTVTPSTDNTHLWGWAGMSWTNLQKIINHERIANPGYALMNSAKGFCSLRPPWVTKYGNLSPDVPVDSFGFHQFAVVTPPEPTPEPGVGWDELGWDD